MRRNLSTIKVIFFISSHLFISARPNKKQRRNFLILHKAATTKKKETETIFCSFPIDLYLSFPSINQSPGFPLATELKNIYFSHFHNSSTPFNTYNTYTEIFSLVWLFGSIIDVRYLKMFILIILFCFFVIFVGVFFRRLWKFCCLCLY